MEYFYRDSLGNLNRIAHRVNISDEAPSVLRLDFLIGSLTNQFDMRLASDLRLRKLYAALAQVYTDTEWTKNSYKIETLRERLRGLIYARIARWRRKAWQEYSQYVSEQDLVTSRICDETWFEQNFT